MNLSRDFFSHPSVFAVEDKYQIIVSSKKEMMVWIEVSGETFYDHSNGILRSASPVHKISVPMKLLDDTKEYTVCYRNIIERKSYFSETEDVKKVTYTFAPVEKNKEIRIFHVSDSHSRVEESIASAKTNNKEFDLLIINGDVAEDSNTVENIIGMYEISGGISEGKIPCIYSRGNHDLRGLCAEKLSELAPENYGKTYYTFRLGDLWGMVLDCGEDKNDDQEEYGNTICCHAFRKEEIQFIKDVISKGNFNDNGIKHKVIVCHIPFTRINYDHDGLFNIENDLYNEWCKLINKEIKPELMLCGHVHICTVVMPGDKMDHRGQSCPVILGGNPRNLNEEKGFTGMALTFSDDSIKVKFCDNLGNEKEAKVK